MNKRRAHRRPLKQKRVHQLPADLIAAVQDNDVAKLQSLQQSGHSLNVIAEDGHTLLHEAIRHRKAEAFDFLLNLEDVPLGVIYDGASPIEAAFNTFNPASEDYALDLIEKGCRLDYRDREGNTLLHRAIVLGWIAVAEELIERGADVNCQNKQGETPLFLACAAELVDEVFMLLFYGADPFIESFFWKQSSIDKFAKIRIDVMQEFFFNTLYPHCRTVDFSILMEASDDWSDYSGIIFRLLENTTEIKINDPESLSEFIQNFPEFDSDFLKLFIDKFTYVVEEIIQSLLAGDFFSERPLTDVDVYTENLYIILSHHIVGPQIIEKLNEERCLTVCQLIKIFNENDGDLETLTKLVCFLLSCGVNLYHQDFHQVFTTYGYCELFKIMLHMDVGLISQFHGILKGYIPIMPTIIYDVNMTIELYLCMVMSSETERKLMDLPALYTLLEYFALPEVKKFCLSLDEEGLTARVLQLPTVPRLLELARNSARAFIIKNYRTRNSRQFYTVLNCLPICRLHRQIIALESKLYLTNDTQFAS